MELFSKIQQIEIEAKNQASPFISEASRRLKSKEKSNKDVVQRLYNYQRLYDGKKLDYKNKNLEKFQFKPFINHDKISSILKDKKTPITARPKSSVNSYQNECTFHPNISQKSKLIANYLVFFSPKII